MMKCDALIIGAGVPGMALAVLLGRAGLQVVLADAGGPVPDYDPARPDGRTVALMGGSIDVLAGTGIGDQINALGSPLKRMSVIDDSRFPRGAENMVTQTFDAAEMKREAFGWNMPLPALRAALQARIRADKNISFLTGVRLTDIKEQTAALGDKTVRFSLLVGADGRDSAVRSLSHIEAEKRPYGQTAMTCVIRHSRTHDDTSAEFHRPGGPFTLVPMPNNHSAIVWVEKDEDANAFLKLPREAFTHALQERTRAIVGQVTLVTNPVSWPLEFVRAASLTAPRTALVAEAAHVLSPIGAQGLNLSLRDIKQLADTVIGAHQSGLDIGSDTVLAQYARARRGDVLSRSTAIDFTNQMVANDSEPLRALRRLTLRALSLPGPLRRLMMRKGLAA